MLSEVKTYKPIELGLQQVPEAFADEHAACPNCLRPGVGVVVGRLGRRLVFKCQECRVHFHRGGTGEPLA